MNASAFESKLVVFTDLDDTLFQTRGKRDVPGSVTAALDRQGVPLSFACPKQQRLLACLMSQATVIPTTARTYDAYRRVQIAFSSFAILNFGATLLNPGGDLDEEWHTVMCGKAQAHRNALEYFLEAARELNSRSGLNLKLSLATDFGEAWYVLAKHERGQSDHGLNVLEKAWHNARPGYVVRRNGNNLTLSPTFLDKKFAVQEVIRRHFNPDTDVFIGAGDSLSDFDFMAVCDFLLVPRATQLQRHIAKGMA